MARVMQFTYEQLNTQFELRVHPFVSITLPACVFSPRITLGMQMTKFPVAKSRRTVPTG